MQETSSEDNRVDLSGRFVPDGSDHPGRTFAEQVAHRAYFLYIDSAARHGHDLEHWLLAEKQLRAEGSLNFR